MRTREKTEETVISEDRACMEEDDWDWDSGSSAYGFGIGMCGIPMLTSMLTDITYAHLGCNIYHNMFDSSLDDNSWLSSDDDDSFSACDDSWSSSFDDD
jgi:hypothetical protein